MSKIEKQPRAGKFNASEDLAALEVTDCTGLFQRINETLVHFGTAGAPLEGALLLPVFDKMPTCPQKVSGYGDDGVFDPATLGAACLIGKEGIAGLIKTDNSEAKVVFNPSGSRKETYEVPGLHKIHCSFKPREGESKRQFEFTPYKFELTDFLRDSSGVYLVINMQRTWSTPPKTDSQEQGGAATSATCYTPPSTTKADVCNKPTGSSPTSPGPGSDSSWVVRARRTR